MRRSRMLVALTAVAIAGGGVTAGIASATGESADGTAAKVSSPAKQNVTTADAAPVAAGNAAEAKTAAAVATKTVWTRRSTKITYGQSAILEGQVQITEGALPNVPVHLYSRSTTSNPWTKIATTNTNSSTGLFRFDRKTPQNYYYTVVFRGDANYGRSSASAKVLVRRNLTPSYMTSAPGGKFYFYGPAKPAAKSVNKTVKLWVKTCSTCSWRDTSSTKTNSKGSWRFLLSGPSRPNRTYYYRAYIPSSSYFLVGYSDEWRITT